MEREFIYDAFVSYRYTNPDKFIAAKLQKLLEKYNPPASIESGIGSKRLHIFRDETELATSSNLSEEIRAALEKSRYLIVICSKTINQSNWCIQEINYFKAIHGGSTDNIITVLIEGDPSEGFPAELCTETRIITAQDGFINAETINIEPLVANVSASTVQESWKKLKREYLRIAAPLLGCGFDDLYRRNQKRLVRRIVTIAASLVLFLAGFGTYSSAMNLQIRSQRNEINENYRDLQIQQSLYLSQESARHLENGDNLQAVMTALEGLPYEDENRPLVTESEYALTNALHAYKTSGHYSLKTFQHAGIIQGLYFVANGQRVVSYDSTGRVYIWNVADGSLVSARTMENNEDIISIIPLTEYIIENYTLFDTAPGSISARQDDSGVLTRYHYKKEILEGNLDTSPYFLVVTEDSMYKLNSIDGEISWQSEEKNAGRSRFRNSDSAWLLDENTVVTINYDNIEFFDLNDGKRIKTISTSISDDYKLSMSTTGIRFASDNIICAEANVQYKDFVLGIKDFDHSRDELALYNTESGESYIVSNAPEGWGNHIIRIETFEKNNTVYTLEEAYESIFDMDMNRDKCITSLNKYNTITGEVIWSYRYMGVRLDGLSKMGKIYQENSRNLDTDVVFIDIGRSFLFVDDSNGELLYRYSLEDTVNHMTYSEGGLVNLLLDNGEEITMVITPNKNYKWLTFELPKEISISDYFQDNYVIAEYNSTTAYYYSELKNPDYKEITKIESSVSLSDISPDGSKIALAVFNYDEEDIDNDDSVSDKGYDIFIYDINSSAFTKFKSYTDVGFVSNMLFCAENELLLVNHSQFIVYDTNSGETVFSKETNLSISDEIVINAAKSIVGLSTGKIVAIYNVSTKKWIEYIPKVKSETDFAKYDEGRIKLCKFNGTLKKAALVVDYNNDQGAVLEIHDLSEEEVVRFRNNMGMFDVKNIHWSPDSSLLGVVLADGKYFVYTSDSGEIVAKFTERSLNVESAYFYDNANIVILGSDASINFYNIDNGLNEHKINLSTDIINHYDMEKTNYYYDAEKNSLIVDLNGNAWVIDLDSFSIRAYIENFEKYSREIKSVLVSNSNSFGLLPFYTIEMLIDMAVTLINQAMVFDETISHTGIIIDEDNKETELDIFD